MIRKIDLMLDLETTGTQPGCGILSIAAVPFDVPYPLEYFYQQIRLDSNAELRLVSDRKTMEWWGKQSEAARSEAFGGTVDIMITLTEFAAYCKSLPAAPILWGNGADFDAPILKAAYDAAGISIPWHYSDTRCYRTLKNLFGHVVQDVPVVKHNALEDAKAQAATAERIIQMLVHRGAIPDASNP